MLFSSITFCLFFLPVVVLLYYLFPNRMYRNSLLLASSLLFYAWGEPKLVFLMMGSILFNYCMGRLMERTESKKTLLVSAIVVNIGVLFVFKYLGFTCEIINRLVSSLHIRPLETLNLVMPIGISFYTFQTITYLVDTYRNPGLTQKNILNLGLYITFFPQLVAGPIVRYHDIGRQIVNRSESLEKAVTGLTRFIVGLSKKVLIANNLAIVCDAVYAADPATYGTLAAWIAAVAYALQIYYDFSGYSDMAIGLAKIFGFDILENFNYPYAASSVTDFWKRWHISLTSFFRDYVYIPLGGNRKGGGRTMFNRIFVFFLTGLWHGAAVHFVCWGLLHGGAMILERALKLHQRLKGLPGAFYRIFTLANITCLWVVFRNGMKGSLCLLLKMFGADGLLYPGISRMMEGWPDLCWKYHCDTKFCIILLIAVVLCFPWWKKIRLGNHRALSRFLEAASYAVLAALWVTCVAFLAKNTYNPFIYFRF